MKDQVVVVGIVLKTILDRLRVDRTEWSRIGRNSEVVEHGPTREDNSYLSKGDTKKYIFRGTNLYCSLIIYLQNGHFNYILITNLMH